MPDHMNGRDEESAHLAAAEASETKADDRVVPRADPDMVRRGRDALDERLGMVMTVTIQGILHSCPGIPAHEVMNSISRVVGKQLASSFRADLTTMIQLRKGFKDAFDEGVKQAPLMVPPGTPAPHA